jgi:hypothetical protein
MLFIKGCQDPVQTVAVAALSSTGSYISALSNESEIMILKDVLSPMLNVMNTCLQNGDEETVSSGLDVLQECFTLDQPLINDHVEVI